LALSKSSKEMAAESMSDMRKQIDSMWPDDCCKKVLMVESNGAERMLCADDCKWATVYRQLAVVDVDVGMLPSMKRPKITHVAIRFQDRIWSLPRPYRHHHVLRTISWLVEEFGQYTKETFTRDIAKTQRMIKAS